MDSKAAIKGLDHSAFYACGGFTFNVSHRAYPPGSKEIKIASASQWSVLSRHLIEDLLDPSRHPPSWKKFNFYMATSGIPDETYIPTFVLNSFHVVHNRPFHFLKGFSGRDAYHLCR